MSTPNILNLSNIEVIAILVAKAGGEVTLTPADIAAQHDLTIKRNSDTGEITLRADKPGVMT